MFLLLKETFTLWRKNGLGEKKSFKNKLSDASVSRKKKATRSHPNLVTFPILNT